jgi:hypothetical protein
MRLGVVGSLQGRRTRRGVARRELIRRSAAHVLGFSPDAFDVQVMLRASLMMSSRSTGGLQVRFVCVLRVVVLCWSPASVLTTSLEPVKPCLCSRLGFFIFLAGLSGFPPLILSVVCSQHRRVPRGLLLAPSSLVHCTRFSTRILFTLHCMPLYYATPRCTTQRQHCTVLRYTARDHTTHTTLDNTTLHCTSTTLHYTTLHSTTRHGTALHNTALHKPYTTLHDTTRHDTTQYIALHNTTLH